MRYVVIERVSFDESESEKETECRWINFQSFISITRTVKGGNLNPLFSSAVIILCLLPHSTYVHPRSTLSSLYHATRFNQVFKSKILSFPRRESGERGGWSGREREREGGKLLILILPVRSVSPCWIFKCTNTSRRNSVSFLNFKTYLTPLSISFPLPRKVFLVCFADPGHIIQHLFPPTVFLSLYLAGFST